AFALLRPHLRELLAAGRNETLRGWLRRFPTEFVLDGVARQLLFTWAFGRAGDIARARAIAASARADHGGDAGDIALALDVVGVAEATTLGDPGTAVSLGEVTWERRASDGSATGTTGPARPADLAEAVEELWGYLPLAMARSYALLDDRGGVRRWARVLRHDGPRLPSDLVGILAAE